MVKFTNELGISTINRVAFRHIITMPIRHIRPIWHCHDGVFGKLGPGGMGPYTGQWLDAVMGENRL